MTYAALPDCRIALILAGGNALGAYQAGVYQALHDNGVLPDWIVGTSIGAINGAIIAGNREEDRLQRLAELWQPAHAAEGWPMWWDAIPDDWRRISETLATVLAGRAGLFGPLGTGLAYHGDRSALYDTSPAAAVIPSLVDIAHLNSGAVRFTALAVELDNAEETTFDTTTTLVTPDHIRASAAMPPLFPAVAIGGRRYVDGGFAANLPLDPALSDPGTAPLLCIAVDLLPAAASRPRTLGETISRTQDLLFACQTRRSIDRWQTAYTTGPFCDRSATIVRLTYADQDAEIAAKAMDFSAESVRRRWDVGVRDGTALVDSLVTGTIAVGEKGLRVVDT